MVTTYNKKDLVRFGEYLLSEKRTERILSNCKDSDPTTPEERLRTVYHADFENWKHEFSLDKKSIEDLDHWCSYSGITDENKEELLSIISGFKSLS